MNQINHIRAINNNFVVDTIRKIREKKSGQILSIFSLLPLAACGGAGTGPAQAPAGVIQSNFSLSNGNVFTGTDQAETLNQSDTNVGLIVDAKAGNDVINTGSGADKISAGAGHDTINSGAGNDLIRGGLGGDTINAGAGNDIIVVVGTTTASQYTNSSITNPAGMGLDLSSLVSLSDLNDQAVSEASGNDVIDGGSGTDVLVIYGTVDMTNMTISNISTLWVNSDVTLTQSQLDDFNDVEGDGNSIVRVEGQTVDLGDVSFSDVGTLVLDSGAKLALTSASDVDGISTITTDSGSITMVIKGGSTNENTLLLSDISGSLSNVDAVEIEAGATLIIDDLALWQSGNVQSIVGDGNIKVDQTKVDIGEALLVSQSSNIGESISLTDLDGNSLEITTVISEDGVTKGSSGDDIVVYESGDNTVTSGAGNDIIVTSEGSDMIMAGAGADQIYAGAGDDFIVMVGTTSSGQYSNSSINNSAGSGLDVSSLLDQDSLNSKSTSDAMAGEVIDGGSGNDSLVIYGTIDLTGATLINLDEIIVNSDLRISAEQFNQFHAVKGDGASIVRVTGGTTTTTIDGDDTTVVHENRGHGNNTDGQDDDNPGQGHGGPNFKEKDGVDEDEGANPGHSQTTGSDGTITIVEIATIDLDWTRLTDIGTLSLEGDMIITANGPEDFAGINHIVSDGNAILKIYNDKSTPMDLNFGEINFSGFAVLDLYGSFNITAYDADDFTGFGEVQVDAGADITLNLVSDALGDVVKDYDLTLSSFGGVDSITVDGNARLIFKDLDQLKASGVESLSGTGETLILVFEGDPNNPTEILVSELAAMVSAVTSIELGDNVTIVNDDQEAMEALFYDVDVDVIMTTSGDDYISASDGRDHYNFDVSEGWGTDTIANFGEGDTLNFDGTELTMDDLVIQYKTDGVLISIGSDSVFLEGFDGVIQNTGEWNSPTLGAVPESERRDDDGILIDIRPPEYDGLVFSSDTVTLHDGEHLYINALVGDDISGVDFVQLYIQGPDGQMHYAYLYDGTDFNYKFDVNDYLPEGEYSVVKVYVRDHADNTYWYEEDELETLGLNQSFTIINDNEDLDPAVLTGVTLSAATLDGSVDNDPLFIHIDGTDNLSGVYKAWATFTGPSGQVEHVWIYDKDGMSHSLDFGKYQENGSWTLTALTIYDHRSLGTVYNAEDLVTMGLDVSFDIVNSEYDNTPPELVSASLSTDTYYRNEDTDMVLTVDATDDISGVDFLWVRFVGPEGTYIYTTIHMENGGEAIVNVGDFAPPGTYTLDYAYGYDNADNYVNYSAEDFASLGIDLSFEVVGKAAVSIESTVGNDLLIGGDGADYFVFGLNWGKDEVSDFIIGEDKIDVTGTGLEFADFTQSINTDGLLLENGENSILLLGISEVLTETDFAIWHGNDDTPPVLTGVTVEAETFDAITNDNFIVGFSATDDNSGINQARLTYTSPSGETIQTTVRQGDNYKGNFEAVLFNEIGTYSLTKVEVWDNQFNYIQYGVEDLGELGISSSFDVTAVSADTAAPVLAGVTLSATTYEAGSNDGIVIHLDASDDLSGINYGRAVFQDENGKNYYHYMYQYGDMNKEFTTSKWAEPHTYTLVEVELYDDAGNKVEYNADDLAANGISASFDVVNNGVVDTTAPTATSDIYSSKPWIAAGDPVATNIFVGLDDDISGPGWGYAQYTGPDGSTFNAYFNDMKDGYGVGEYNVDASDNAGTYTLTYMYVSDMAGSYQYYYEDDLAALGISDEIRVLNDGPPDGTVVTGTDEAETIVGTTDDEVFTLHRGDDVLEFGGDWGADTVLDFTQGEDTLDFSAAGIAEGDLTQTQTDYGLMIEDEEGNTLLLQDFVGTLGENDIVYGI